MGEEPTPGLDSTDGSSLRVGPEAIKSSVGTVTVADTGTRESVLTFHEWTRGWIDDGIAEVTRKSATYGSNSLAEMGRLFAKAQQRGVGNTQALRMGCMLYAYGKMQRWIDAALNGQDVAEDTLDDLAIYTLMARFIGEEDRWP